MADITHPKTKFGARPTTADDGAVSGFAVTPAEGLDQRDVPKLPLDPKEVLELLKARLALDSRDIDNLDAAAEGRRYESAPQLPSSWPPKNQSPSSPDITPSPVVIGVTELEAMGADVALEDQRSTPAEPIASVRVIQASVSPPAPPTPEAPRDAWTGHPLGSAAGSLYFPPMKPPESWQRDRENEPLVQVVPDCDSKVKTAKSLRRNSNWPTPSYLSEIQKRPSILLASGVSILAIFGLALLIAPWHRDTKPKPTRSVSGAELLPAPVAPVASVDSGTVQNEPAASVPQQSSGAPSTNPNRARAQTRERRDEVPTSKPTKAPKSLAPSTDSLVF